MIAIKKYYTMFMPLLLAVLLLAGCGIRVNVNPQTASIEDMLTEQALVADPVAFSPNGSYSITFRSDKGGFKNMDLSQAYVAYYPYSIMNLADKASEDIPPLPTDAQNAISQAIGADKLEKIAIIRIETVDDKTLKVSFEDSSTLYPEKEYYFIIPNEGIAGSVLPEYQYADNSSAPPESSEAEKTASRQDGERFEDVIILEGMEETVHYEHIRNDSLGFEMDYDYENFVRHSEAAREWFVSCWEDPDNPENYLEVRYSPLDAESAAAAISETLSNDYEISRDDSFPLDRAGSCILILAEEVKGGGFMPDHLQSVYIIPAADGCRIATAHCATVESEGFLRRFRYMMNTFSAVVEETNAGENQQPSSGSFTGVQGTEFIIPDGFIQLDESPNIGYQYTFWHPEYEIRIVVYEIAPGYIPEGAYETDYNIASKNPDVTYFNHGENWFVQSGYNNNGEEIFYSKESTTDRGLKTFWITYPTAKREFGDPIAAEFEKNCRF